MPRPWRGAAPAAEGRPVGERRAARYRGAAEGVGEPGRGQPRDWGSPGGLCE